MGEAGKVDDVFDGGIGYGNNYPHSDMGNTLFALEALYYSKQLVADQSLAEAKDLNWPAVTQFIADLRRDDPRVTAVFDPPRDRFRMGEQRVPQTT